MFPVIHPSRDGNRLSLPRLDAVQIRNEKIIERARQARCYGAVAGTPEREKIKIKVVRVELRFDYFSALWIIIAICSTLAPVPHRAAAMAPSSEQLNRARTTYCGWLNFLREIGAIFNLDFV